MKDKNLILQAFKSEEYKLIETEDAIEVPFIVLKANQIMTPLVNGKPQKTKFLASSIEKIAKDLERKPVLIDHKEAVSNIIGVVSKTEIKDDYLIAYTKFPKTKTDFISLIKLNPSPINQVSIGGYIRAYTNENDVIVIEDFKPKELSIVIDGASPSTKRLDAKKSQEVSNMDELKELIKKQSKLEASLEEKEKELASLKAKLEEKEKEIAKLQAHIKQTELASYKAQKLSEIPEALKAMARPAIEIASSKEEIDKLIAEYKKMTNATVVGYNPPDSQNFHKSEDNPFNII